MSAQKRCPFCKRNHLEFAVDRVGGMTFRLSGDCKCGCYYRHDFQVEVSGVDLDALKFEVAVLPKNPAVIRVAALLESGQAYTYEYNFDSAWNDDDSKTLEFYRFDPNDERDYCN